MPALILPRRFYSQPQGAVEPVAGIGVSSLVVPANWYGYTTTAAPTVAVGTQGVLLKSESNNASRYKAADRIALTPAASIMWVGEFYGSGTSDGSLGGITYANTNTAPYVGIELKRLNAGGASGNVYLTWNNTSTYLYLGNSVSQDVTGQFVIIGSVQSGSQFFLLRNLTTGSTTYLTDTVSGNIAYGSAPRLEVGDSLNARHPNAGCAMLATFDHAISEGFARDLLDNPWQIFRAKPRVLYFDVAGGAGTHNLSGSAVSALASTLSAEIDVAINGVSVTTSTGTLSPAIEVTSSGSAVSVLSGSISPSLEVALSGESVATSAGTVSSGSDTVLALSGSQATSSVGPLSIAVDVALSGQSVSAETGIVGSGSDTTQALSGSSVATQSGTLAQDTDLALSGSVVEVSAGIISGIEGVERTLTGSAVTSNAGNVSESIEIALTGQNVTTESGFIGAGADVTKALTGSQVTVAQQTLYSDIAVTAVGAASTVVVGSIFGNSEVGLLGIELTPTLGAFVPNITCSINGSQAITYTGILTGYDVLNIVRNVVARNAYVSSKVSKTSILSFKVSKGVQV